MIRVVLIVHPPHAALAHAFLVAIALLRSPIATNPNILSRLPILLSGLLRLLRGALWLLLWVHLVYCVG
jgi:hypothetical protein